MGRVCGVRSIIPKLHLYILRASCSDPPFCVFWEGRPDSPETAADARARRSLHFLLLFFSSWGVNGVLCIGIQGSLKSGMMNSRVLCLCNEVDRYDIHTPTRPWAPSPKKATARRGSRILHSPYGVLAPCKNKNKNKNAGVKITINRGGPCRR